MKRYLLGVLAVAFVLAGCAGGSDPNPDPDPTPTPSAPIEGRWTGEVGSEAAVDEDYVRFDVWLEQSGSTFSNDGDNTSEVVVQLANSSLVNIETSNAFVTGNYNETSGEVSFEADLMIEFGSPVRTVDFVGTLMDSALSGEVTVRGEDDDVLASFTNITLNKQ